MNSEEIVHALFVYRYVISEYYRMRKIFLCMALICPLLMMGQFNVDFQYVPQYGGVYAIVYNTSGYQASIKVVAHNDYNGQTMSWDSFLYPNGYASFGSANGWNWEAGETLTVYYTYYGELKSLSWRYSPQSNITFKGNKIVRTKNKCSHSGCHCSGFVGELSPAGIYKGSCQNTDGWGHTCGHSPREHGL